jgi:hypothetical protein
MTELAVGLSGVHSAVVRDNDTAIALGSGSVPVLATPRLVAWLEAAAVAAVDETIRDGSTTVGTLIDLQHLAPTANDRVRTIRHRRPGDDRHRPPYSGDRRRRTFRRTTLNRFPVLALETGHKWPVSNARTGWVGYPGQAATG